MRLNGHFSHFTARISLSPVTYCSISFFHKTIFPHESLYIHLSKYMFTRHCLQKGLVRLPLSLRACVPYIMFADDAATPPCIHTSRLRFFYFLFFCLSVCSGNRFNCGGIFTKQKQAVVAAVRETGRALGKQPEFALKVLVFFVLFFYCTACAQRLVCKQRAILVETRFLNHHNP